MPLKSTDIPDRVKAQIFDLISPHLDFSDVIEAKDALIVGIEATQSIQYYKSNEHLSDRALQAMDNAVVLAASKPAWVRTYVRTNRFTPVPGIRGTLTVERRRLGFLWDNITTLNAQGIGSVTARPFTDYDTERSSTFNSLNFIIPAADCVGILRLTVKLMDASGAELDTSSVVVHATLKQTLRLRGIMIGYNGPSTAVMAPGSPPPPTITLAAPTVAGLQSTAARALLAMPVQSSGNFSTASQITFNLPLDDARASTDSNDPSGGCSVNWDALMELLATERTNDGNRSDVVYYGLLPAAMPVGVPGCGRNGLGAGRVGDSVVLLHEIGHGYGFDHTPCGPAGTTDPEYPDYKPYPSASIGEYGIDISNGTIFPPRITSDYMSYCFPQWLSLYQHGRLVGHPRLDPKWLNDNPIWDQHISRERFTLPPDIADPLLDPDPNPWRIQQLRREPVISIIGRVISRTEVDVISVARVMAEATLTGPAVAFEARLLDAEGQLLARASLHELSSHGACCNGCHSSGRHGEPPYLFQALIRDVEPGHSLLIGRDDDVLWERQAPSLQPQINEVHADVHADTLQLQWTTEWTTEGGDEGTEAWVQWSNREGIIWHGLATGLNGDSAEISIAHLPAGDALVRMLAHDGFHTAVSHPAPIEVPSREPVLAIMTPVDGETLFAGNPVRLWGSITDCAGNPLPDREDSRWLLDGREVGRGSDIWITSPAPGEHRATLVANVNGVEARTSASFTTIGGYRDGC